MNWNIIHTIEEYNYTYTGEIDFIETITTIHFLNFFYLVFKIGLLIWLLFYLYKRR